MTNEPESQVNQAPKPKRQPARKWRYVMPGEVVIEGDEYFSAANGEKWYSADQTLGMKVAAGEVGLFRRFTS